MSIEFDKVCNFSIIGAGVIGSGSNGRQQVSHAAEITKNKASRLKGFFDKSSCVADKAAKDWSAVSYRSINELLADAPDVVIICTPNETHYAILLEVLRRPPRLVICEKPLTNDYSLSECIVELYEKAGCNLWVNYQRRFDPLYREIALKYQNGKFGRFLAGSLVYSKGLKHNGSHGVDLILSILGTPNACFRFAKRHDWDDENDPSVFGSLVYPDGLIYLTPGHEESYGVFELDLMFEKTRFRFEDFTASVREYKPDFQSNNKAKQDLKFVGSRQTDLHLCFSRLVQSAVHLVFDQSYDSSCSANNILKTQELCELISDKQMLLAGDL